MNIIKTKWNKEIVLTYKNEDLPKGVGVLDLEKGRIHNKTDFPWLTDDSFAWHGWSWRDDLELKTSHVIIAELIDIVSKKMKVSQEYLSVFTHSV